jgi:hypothetical protein
VECENGFIYFRRTIGQRGERFRMYVRRGEGMDGIGSLDRGAVGVVWVITD